MQGVERGGFGIEVVRGTPRQFHARPLPAEPVVWWFEATSPALVLGTAQREEVVDREACGRAGVDVVRRHSGGGAVLVVPGELAWFDVVIPRGHPRWHDDVGRAAWWVGEAVAAAVGLEPDAVHRGPLVKTAWSSLVCFAGLGPGEVSVNGAKLLGLSQRRTRDAARFQCAVHRQWSPEVMVPLLSPPAPTAADLAPLVASVALELADLTAHLG